MGLNKDILFGALIGALTCFGLMACAGATFPYKGYPYDMDNHKLIGQTEADDLDDRVCEPTTLNKRPCIVVLTDDYYTLKADYIKTKDALDACERGSSP